MQNRTIPRRLGFVVASVAALCLAGAIMAALPYQQAQVAVCKGDKNKDVQIPQLGTFDAPSTGQIASSIGSRITTPAGLPGTSLKVIEFTDTGASDGLGTYSFHLDQARQDQAGQSYVQENKDGSLTQVMRFHLTAQVEALGSQTLFTASAVEVASQLDTFPQTGATYHMLGPVDFVDAEGKVQMTIRDTTVQMTDTRTF